MNENTLAKKRERLLARIEAVRCDFENHLKGLEVDLLKEGLLSDVVYMKVDITFHRISNGKRREDHLTEEEWEFIHSLDVPHSVRRDLIYVGPDKYPDQMPKHGERVNKYFKDVGLPYRVTRAKQGRGYWTVKKISLE